MYCILNPNVALRSWDLVWGGHVSGSFSPEGTLSNDCSVFLGADQQHSLTGAGDPAPPSKAWLRHQTEPVGLPTAVQGVLVTHHFPRD